MNDFDRDDLGIIKMVGRLTYVTARCPLSRKRLIRFKR